MSPREAILNEIRLLRLSAIVRTKNQKQAEQAMWAAVAGGFRLVEFTLTTPGAYELIEEFSSRPGLCVGAGTVMTVEEAEKAVAAGARFLVSPITDAAVITAAHRLDVISIPGTTTPTEMMEATRLGADIVKLFPAPADLPTYVRQIRGPLPDLKIFPTSGVDETNFIDLLRAGVFGVGFVSSLFRHEELARGDFDAIEARATGIFGQLLGASL